MIAQRLSRIRAWGASLRATGRFEDRVRSAEQTGLAFAFRCRAVAISIVAVWLLVLLPWPREGYYLSYAFAFFLSGYVPFRLRRHRHAEAIKLFFVVVDVALITIAVVLQPLAALGSDWPAQARMRAQEFLYLPLLLGEAALTYSPLRVVWTGLSIVTIWSAGFWTVYLLPTTKRFFDLPVELRSDADVLKLAFDPHFVSLAQWMTQVIATMLLAVLLTLAVLRSRGHLLAEVKAEVGRSDLARYISPDVADALTDQASSGFGEPTTRVVTVLFADIVGFTGATESLAPERTFAFLRSFQERSSKIVRGHRGTIDKYLGDGLMATFGALQDEGDAPARAIACSFNLLDEIGRWNVKRRERGAEPVLIAIGVHCGSVMVGNLGSDERIEFTVVGDVVNVASRLEKASRELECSLVVSQACLGAAGSDRLAESFDRIVELQLRGRAVPLLVHIAGARRPHDATPVA